MWPSSTSRSIQGPESASLNHVSEHGKYPYIISTTMKIPCELVVWYVLPTMRREVAKELVEAHGLSQAQVARMFGVTDAAISQYLKKKRGNNLLIDESPNHPMFEQAVKEAAARMAEDGSEFSVEMCNICMIVKEAGILDRIYRIEFGSEPPKCTCEHDITVSL